jgi:hypothetical protein
MLPNTLGFGIRASVSRGLTELRVEIIERYVMGSLEVHSSLPFLQVCTLLKTKLLPKATRIH